MTNEYVKGNNSTKGVEPIFSLVPFQIIWGFKYD